MADTPKEGETGAPQAPENNANNQGTPPAAPPAAPVKTEDNSAVERLTKELEQAKMRANQLENEKKQRDDAEAARKAKELEEQNQFKDLYEQEKAKREELETTQEKAERETELRKAKTEVLAEYNDEVRGLAEEVGLDLTDTDESAVASFKEKLDKINSKVTATGSVGPNNRQEPKNNDAELSGDDLKRALGNEDSFHELVVKKYPGIASMTESKK